MSQDKALVAELASFSPAKYVEAYPAWQRIPRLLHIERRAASLGASTLAVAAGTACETLMLAGCNTQAYKEHQTQLFAAGLTQFTIDEAWVAERDAAASRELESLQVKFGNVQAGANKDAVRGALVDLANFYARRGDYPNAFKHATRARDGTNDSGAAEHSMLMVTVNMTFGNVAAAAQFAQKLETLPEPQVSEAHFVVSRVVGALAQLDRKNYKNCALTLQSLRQKATTPADAALCDAVLPPGDLLLIATLTALATHDRAELAAFLANPDLKVLAETDPGPRAVAQLFYECDYTRALAALQALQVRITMDLFLSSHVTALRTTIRQNAMKQYASPFLTLDMREMATAFGLSLGELEGELGSLIHKGVVKARIDRANWVLRATSADEKSLSFERALHLGDHFVQDTESTLRILSLVRNDVHVRGPRDMSLARVAYGLYR